VTLSSLAPRRGELLWDIGAGAGSIAIEWMLADPSFMRAIAIETTRRSRRAHPPQRRRLRRAAAGNRGRFRAGRAGAPGNARCDLHRRRRRRRRRARCRRSRRLRPGGRLVVNAVTLETEALLLARHAYARRRSHSHRRQPRWRRSAKSRLAQRDAGDAMGVDQAMIVAGVGCRRVGVPSSGAEDDSRSGGRPYDDALRARARADRRAVGRGSGRARRRRPGGAADRPRLAIGPATCALRNTPEPAS
jgi:hypothetical protein